MYQNTIPDHYIVENGSYNTTLKSPKATGCTFESETKFLEIFNFHIFLNNNNYMFSFNVELVLPSTDLLTIPMRFAM